MAISAANTNQNQHTNTMVEQNAVAGSVLASDSQTRQRKAKEILDTAFPLETGSHQDVTNYMVYYCNLVACFADGTLVGLQNPKQFVALAGHKQEPESILLKDEHGSHLEIMLGQRKGRTCLANISDIQLESKTTLCEVTQTNHRYWISLMETGAKGDPIAHSLDKEFTGKSGDEYVLNRYC